MTGQVVPAGLPLSVALPVDVPAKHAARGWQMSQFIYLFFLFRLYSTSAEGL